jgi:hypothetical protein
MEAVAAGMAAGRHAEQRRGHDVLAEEHHHPVHRAHEQRLALTPAHAARDGQLIERRLHQCRQQPHGFLARACSGEIQESALDVRDALERLHGGAAALGEGERGARRGAARIEGGTQRRSAALQLLLGSARGEAPHQYREAPRGGKA